MLKLRATAALHMYLLHYAVHVVFVGHARQLQVDGNVFTDVRYGRDSLQTGSKDPRII